MHRVKAVTELPKEDPCKYGVIPQCLVYVKKLMPPEIMSFAASTANESTHSVVQTCFI